VIDSLEDYVKEMQESTNALSNAFETAIDAYSGLPVKLGEWVLVDAVRVKVRASAETFIVGAALAML
jgi:hypothetical protein